MLCMIILNTTTTNNDIIPGLVWPLLTGIALLLDG